MKKEKANQIIDLLQERHPDAICELEFTSVYELLVATVLSAQTTDVKVNQATRKLFQVANTPEKMIELTPQEIKGYIKTLGLSNSKAGYVHELSLQLLEKYNGQVPQTIEELTLLSGVGRKTANVVLSVGFQIPSMAVDTHVKRLANRLGFSNTDNVLIIEEDLKRQIPKYRWILAHHLLIFHGRRVCKARNPECDACTLQSYCKYYKSNASKR
ncbi:MAG: endonuclease III [Clostridia bacterium]|nr:endonuclease III [Clostridia bacterium]